MESEIRHEEERFGKLMSNVDPKSPNLQSEVGLDKQQATLVKSEAVIRLRQKSSLLKVAIA